MHGNLPAPGDGAIIPAIKSASEKSITAKSGSDEHEWFSGPARSLLGSDAGLALHILSDKAVSESTGYRLARGETGISGWLLRKLLHRSDGEAWLNVTMHGCQAQWWLDLQRHARMGAAAEKAQ